MNPLPPPGSIAALCTPEGSLAEALAIAALFEEEREESPRVQRSAAVRRSRQPLPRLRKNQARTSNS